MSNDIPLRAATSLKLPKLHINRDDLHNYILYEVEILLNQCGKTLSDFALPSLPDDLLLDLVNRLIMEERNYDHESFNEELSHLESRMNVKQRRIYELIHDSFSNNRTELLFVYGHGGTGKTFLWKAIITCLRAKGKIVLVVASYGIASLLLPSGITAHSRFKLPIDLTDESMCNVNKNTQMAKLLESTDLIVWDEEFKVFVLTENMRLMQPGLTPSEKERNTAFSAWLLDIGNGEIGTRDLEDPINSSWIQIPDAYCVPDDDNGLANLISFIYPPETLQNPSAAEL
ncbi:uncharacterized protein [Rutidosis leptorrhynchoides]|uniref:uncharacterized protein n=1 Tax=Rutidosis leptorrhynchoides TaxID=125765 RepID=UPI003A99088D